MTKYLPVNYRLDRTTFWYVGQSIVIVLVLVLVIVPIIIISAGCRILSCEK